MIPPADRTGDSRSAAHADGATTLACPPSGALELPFDRAPSRGLGLTARAWLALLILFVERLVLLALARPREMPGWVALGNTVGLPIEWRFPFLLSFIGCVFAFWYMRNDAVLEAATRQTAFRPRWLAVHILILAALVPSLHSLYAHASTDSSLTPFIAGWSVALTVSAVAACACWLAPLSIWRRAARSVGIFWIYSFLAAVAAVLSMELSQKLWAPTAGITFGLVRLLVHPFVADLATDSAQRIISAGGFAVQVQDACSGLEGAGLMLVFCGGWLTYFRRDYRFPRALLLIPASLGVIFLLNVLRIALLVIIGNAGYSDEALAGFHSHAGWIAFNAAACGIAFISRRSGWLTRDAPAHTENPTAPYLLPLVAILGVGLVTGALSSGFNLLYGLRPLATGVAIAFCWKRLTSLDWSWSWRGVCTGAAMFAVWVAAAQVLTTPQTMPSELAALPASGRVAWLTLRWLAAVVTVPIAEELAYRGFLMRRLADPDFTAVRFSTVGVWPVVISSVVFGLSHGAMWFPGILAGIAYAMLLRRTGRIGEAVAAHATTNLLLGAWVLLASQQWQLW